MKRWHAFLLAMIFSAASWTMPHTEDGPYFGVSLGLSNTRTVKRNLNGGGNVSFLGKKMEITGSAASDGQALLSVADSRSEGYRIIAGYRIWERFAFEFSFDSFGDAEFIEQDGDKMFNNEYALGAQAVGRFPFFYDNFQFTTRLGLSYLRSNLDFSGTFTIGATNVNSSIKNQSEAVTNGIFGVGLAYQWNKKADVTFDLIRYNGIGKIDDVDVIQVGMIYHFVGEM